MVKCPLTPSIATFNWHLINVRLILNQHWVDTRSTLTYSLNQRLVKNKLIFADTPPSVDWNTSRPTITSPAIKCQLGVDQDVERVLTKYDWGVDRALIKMSIKFQLNVFQEYQLRLDCRWLYCTWFERLTSCHLCIVQPNWPCDLEHVHLW